MSKENRGVCVVAGSADERMEEYESSVFSSRSHFSPIPHSARSTFRPLHHIFFFLPTLLSVARNFSFTFPRLGLSYSPSAPLNRVSLVANLYLPLSTPFSPYSRLPGRCRSPSIASIHLPVYAAHSDRSRAAACREFHGRALNDTSEKF